MGATVVLVDGFSFPGRVYAALKESGATSFRCVPAGLTMMLRFAPDHLADFADQIRYVELGSAPMPLEDKMKLMELLPRSRICMHYGLTEAYPIGLHRVPCRSSPAELDWPSKPRACDVRIAGPDGETLSHGMQGEIQIRGAHVTRGYWQDPERTAKSFDGEWFRTGDAGHQDEAGYLSSAWPQRGHDQRRWKEGVAGRSRGGAAYRIRPCSIAGAAPFRILPD